MIKVAVCGAMGKMGKEVCLAVEECPQTELVAKIDIASDGMYHSIDDAHRVEEIDVLVDFTQPKSIFENAKYCLNNGIKIVIGTTGLKDEEIENLKDLDLKLVVYIEKSYNMLDKDYINIGYLSINNAN